MSRRSASSATVAPCGTFTTSSLEMSWSLARASWMACSLAAWAAWAFLCSLRFLRRPVDSRLASSTEARASSRTRSRLYSSAERAMRL